MPITSLGHGPTICREVKRRITQAGEQGSTPDYSDISCNLTFEVGIRGLEVLQQNLENIGLEVRRNAHTVIVWLPLGWTHYTDDNGHNRLFNESGVLRATIKYNDLARTVELELTTRLEYGYSTETNRWYVYDYTTDTCLKSSTSKKRIDRWLNRHYPDHANPAAYRGRRLNSDRWWKIR